MNAQGSPHNISVGPVLCTVCFHLSTDRRIWFLAYVRRKVAPSTASSISLYAYLMPHQTAIRVTSSEMNRHSSGHETLAAIGHRVHDAFAALQQHLKAADNHGISVGELNNESQRFNLWAINMGLYSYSHSSLDYRFRDAPSVYDFTERLLKDLEHCLCISKVLFFIVISSFQLARVIFADFRPIYPLY